MDWRKAKNYIIALLVILNLILLISILGHNNNASIDNPYFSKDALKDFDAMLALYNVRLDTELPHDVYNVGTINVEYKSMDENNFPKLYESFEEITALENTKKLKIVLQKSDLPSVLDSNLNTEEGQGRFAENFLQEYFPGHRFQHKITEGARRVYNPLFGGIIYEDSFVSFEFASNTVSVTAIMVDAWEEASPKKETITSVEAVLNILPELSAGDVITGIDFIYFFDLKEEELYKVKNARAFPHWRIITQSGRVIYTSAFEN